METTIDIEASFTCPNCGENNNCNIFEINDEVECFNCETMVELVRPW
ncbi:MAG: hypothetical protein GY941_22485 [Planctomycetes bacterium]|nr:hypothetical protein [Planctomycetota bacterium]